MTSSNSKRIRVSSLVDSDTPSFIRLRPRAAETPPARRSYRIVSRPSESAPSIIRVAREPSLTSTLENVSLQPDPVVGRDDDSVSILSTSSVIDLEAQPTPAPQAPGSPLSISSGVSFESTLSSDSWDSESPEQPDAYRQDYMQFVSQLFRDQLSDDRVTSLVSVANVAETSENRPEIIEILKFHSGRCVCVVCRRPIAMADICVDFRPRTPAGMIKHCHFGCIDSGTPLYFPNDERLIRFDPQFNDSEKRSYLTQLRARLPPAENPETPIHPLVRPGDPDRRIQRQRDFVNQELARRNRQQDQMRSQLEARRYIDSRREVLSRMTTTPSYNQHIFQPMRHPQPVNYGGLPRGVLYGLPRMHVPSASSVPTPEESDDGKETHCVICLEEMYPGEEILILPCFHKFHSKCIESWFANSKLCPIDKLDIEQLYHRTGNSQDIPPYLRESPEFTRH